MSPNDGLKRYLDAGLALTQITRARAEELVHELIQAGEVETTRAQEWVEDLVKTSRERSDTLLATVRGEVKTQLADLGITSMDDLAHRVAEVLDRAETAARKATNRGPGRGRTAARGATAKKAPPRKAPAKKSPAKSSAAKKTSTRPAGSRGATTKKAAARKPAAKKASAAKGSTKKTAGRAPAAGKARR